MSIDYFVIGILTSLLIGTNAFWMKMVRDLTNRIMSKNYYEVVQAEQLTKQSKAPSVLSKEDDAMDLYAQEQARNLNSLIGVI